MNLFLQRVSQLVSRRVVGPVKCLVDGQFSFFSSCIKQRSNDVPTHRNELLPFTMNNLWNNPGSLYTFSLSSLQIILYCYSIGYRRVAKRVGRGIGSGKGYLLCFYLFIVKNLNFSHQICRKTAGKGTNGHNSRSGGGVSPRQEGGQTPWFRRLPKLGMSRMQILELGDLFGLKMRFLLNISNRERPRAINMSLIMYSIHKGRIDPSKVITIKVLHDAGVFSSAKYGIKLIGKVQKLFLPELNFQK